MKEKTEFTPGPYNAVIEDHSMWDTGEYYTMFCIEAEKEGKKESLLNCSLIMTKMTKQKQPHTC